MIDLIRRALFNTSDYVGYLEKRTLILQEIINEGNDVYSFIFNPEKAFSWKAGQHGVFSFPGEKINGRNWRPFSLASSPLEQEIRVSTILTSTPSAYKKKLASLRKGDRIQLNGPFGEFHIRSSTKHIVGIAGGIGITPFRSLLYEISHQKHPGISIELVYAGRQGSWPFREELQSMAESENITIYFTKSKDETSQKINELVERHKNEAEYFVSGAPAMIDVVCNQLKKLKVKKVINDPFKGY